MIVRLHLPGEPVPKGSRTYLGKGRSKPASAREKPWMVAASQAAWTQAQRHGLRQPLTGPIEVRAVFFCQRPARPRYEYPTAGGDVDKFKRALLDALVQGHVIVDDRHVTDILAAKRFGAPGTVVEIYHADVTDTPGWMQGAPEHVA